MGKTLDELMEGASPEVLAEAERIYQELRKEYDQRKSEEQESDQS